MTTLALMNGNPMVVVFSAIDGALVDRLTESSAGAVDGLDLLAHEGIPLVLCSHNTRAEIEAIQRATRTAHPFISENGAALFVPIGYFADPPEDARLVGDHHVWEFGPSYWEVVPTLHLLASRLHIDVVGFSELSVEEIASTCRVSLDRARLAKQREYDEPFRMVNPGRPLDSRLMRAVRAAGLSCLAGERFQHVNGVLDRGASIERLRSMYERSYGCPVLAVGLGSSLCDLALLNEVDLPIIVRDEWSSTADVLFRTVPIARIASRAGAGGWSQAVINAVRTIQKMRRAGALPP